MQLNQFKNRYQALQDSLKQRFLENPDTVQDLVVARSKGIDALLQEVWQTLLVNKALCLVAVGGYGRGELHLYSDIDLLILIPNATQDTHQQSVAQFLTFLWDIGLEVGHATRDMHGCEVEIKDLTVVTNLLESRFLIGNHLAFTKIHSMIKASNWSSQSFLVGKQKEQHNRHINYADTAYSLEPNLKESPGGLRDIQTVAWVAKWYFAVDTLADLVDKAYLSEHESDLLLHSQLFLWKLRFALHVIAKRREDRIAFQYQKQLANMLGYADTDVMAVEQLMRDYYQTVTKVSRLNDILLQLLEEKILHTQNLNKRFMISHGYIQATNAQVFVQNPSAFMEIFLLIAKHNYVRGISANTLRQMQSDIDIITGEYHKERQNSRLFIELLQQTHGVNRALKLMNRYGVLERYIPVFGKIVGLMQYDLFHAYTVDQHTLFVIRNLRRLFVDDFAKEFELCSNIAKTIRKPALLFLAALFHDIAKGRGGNHANLGAQDARDFCQHHQLKLNDIDMVSGLVKQHLLMSQTAQKQDLEDLEVIDNFAKAVGSVEFLECLYLLSVADIRATKAGLWNDWKDALLKKLFYKTKQYLLCDNIKPPNTSEQIADIKHTAMIESGRRGYNVQQLKSIFSTLPKDYFLRYQMDDILWHLGLLIKSVNQKTLVTSRLSEHNVVDIFIHTDDSNGLFFKLIGVIEVLGLDIVDAKILTSKNQKAYNTISVLPNDILQQINITKAIKDELAQTQMTLRKSKQRFSYSHFDDKIQIDFSHNKKWNLTQIDINILDRQGLLSNIAYIFYQLNIRLVNARVTTMGERVEDIFFISNSNQQPLTKAQELTLKQTLEQEL